MSADFDSRGRRKRINKKTKGHGTSSKTPSSSYPRGMSFMKSILESSSDPQATDDRLMDEEENIPVLHYGDGEDRPKTSRGRSDPSVELVTSEGDSSTPIKVEVNVNVNDQKGLTFDSWAQELGIPKRKGRKRRVVSKKKQCHTDYLEDRLDQKYAELQQLLKAQFLCEKARLDKCLLQQTRQAVKQKQQAAEGFNGRLITGTSKSASSAQVISAKRSSRNETENMSIQTVSAGNDGTSTESGREETHIIIDTIDNTVQYKKVHFPSGNDEDSMTSGNQQDEDINEIERRISEQTKPELRGRPPRRQSARERSKKQLRTRPVSAPSRSVGSATFSGRFRSPVGKRKAKNSVTKAKYLSDASDEESDGEKSRERKSLDHRLKDSENQKIKDWLKQKNRSFRKQRQTEKQLIKEKQKLLQKAAEERKQRQEKSEGAVAEWLQRKKQQSRLLQRQRRDNDRQIKKDDDRDWVDEGVVGKSADCSCCKVLDHDSRQAAERVGFTRRPMSGKLCKQGPHECTCGFMKAQMLKEMDKIERLSYKPGPKSPRPRPTSAFILYDRPSSPQVSSAFPKRSAMKTRPWSANMSTTSVSNFKTDAQLRQEWEKDLMKKRISYDAWLKQRREDEQAGDNLFNSRSGSGKFANAGKLQDGQKSGRNSSPSRKSYGRKAGKSDADPGKEFRPMSSKVNRSRPQSGRSFLVSTPPKSAQSPVIPVESRVSESVPYMPSPPQTPPGQKLSRKSLLQKSASNLSLTNEEEEALSQAGSENASITDDRAPELMTAGQEFDPEMDYQGFRGHGEEALQVTTPASPPVPEDSELSFGQVASPSYNPDEENMADHGRPKTSFGNRPDEYSMENFDEQKPRWDEMPEAPTEHSEYMQEYREQQYLQGQNTDTPEYDQEYGADQSVGESSNSHQGVYGLAEKIKNEIIQQSLEEMQHAGEITSDKEQRDSNEEATYQSNHGDTFRIGQAEQNENLEGTPRDNPVFGHGYQEAENGYPQESSMSLQNAIPSETANYYEGSPRIEAGQDLSVPEGASDNFHASPRGSVDGGKKVTFLTNGVADE